MEELLTLELEEMLLLEEDSEATEDMLRDTWTALGSFPCAQPLNRKEKKIKAAADRPSQLSLRMKLVIPFAIK